jgi:Ca2+-binding RTX toxin-like protein
MPLIIGTPGDDGLVGTNGDDTIESLGGNDVIVGLAGNDSLDGGDGHDILRGQGGDDTLTGGTGDDFLVGGPGNDLLDGGDGQDRAGYASGATAGVHVDLNLQGVAQDTGQGVDTLVNIEHVSGTTFGDTLIGDAGDNWIWGQGGNDSLAAGAGNDLVQLGWTASDDTVDGGSGIDTLSFDGNGSDTAGVHASLALQGAAQDTGRGLVTATGFENLSGSQFADTLTGDANDNLLAGAGGDDSLSGGAGNDVLYGDGQVTADTHGTGGSGPIVTLADAADFNGVAPGNDTLDGGAGDDTLQGGQGDDVLIGGSGNNLLDGGAGSDTADYSTASAAITLFGHQVDHGDGTDTLSGIERVVGSAFDDNMVGGPGNDDLEGGAGHDSLRGHAGDDTLIGGTGDDFLVPGQGNDLIDGGDGFDRAGFFQDATAGVHVDLNLEGTAQDTGMGIKTLIGIEHVSGTNFADTLIGNAGDNWIWGQGGGDSLSAGAGNDLVQLGWVTSNDTVDGGAGNDTLSFDGNGSDTTGVHASLALQGAAQDTGRGLVTATGFENLSGSQFADTLSGDAHDNVLAGFAGDDSLSGGGGNDLLLGDGHATVDTHGTGGSGPIVTLADASAFDQFTAGNDTLDGGTGDDTLIGGGGGDVLTGGKGADHFVFLSTGDSTPAAPDLITDLENKDVIDLSAIDANVNVAGDQAFVLVGAFDGHAGEAVLDYDKAAKVTHLSLDVNGDGVADMVINIAGQAKNFDNFIL